MTTSPQVAISVGRCHPGGKMPSWLEVKPYGEIQYRFAPEKRIHLPSRIQLHKISQQRTPHSKAIASHQRTNAPGSDQHLCASIRIWISQLRTTQFIVSSIPRIAQINELYRLEISDEGIVDWLVQ